MSSVDQVHMSAASRDYFISPRIDYRTVVKGIYNYIILVDGPLVILDNVKFPKFNEIVTVHLKDGKTRKG